jgi:hypothetical protein
MAIAIRLNHRQKLYAWRNRRAGNPRILTQSG